MAAASVLLQCIERPLVVMVNFLLQHTPRPKTWRNAVVSACTNNIFLLSTLLTHQPFNKRILDLMELLELETLNTQNPPKQRHQTLFYLVAGVVTSGIYSLSLNVNVLTGNYC